MNEIKMNIIIVLISSMIYFGLPSFYTSTLRLDIEGNNIINIEITKKPVINHIPKEFLIEEIPYDMKLDPPVKELCYEIKEGKNAVWWRVNTHYHYNTLNNVIGVIYHMKNVFVSNSGAISTGDNEIYFHKTGMNIGPDFLYRFHPGPVVGSYSKVILLGHVHIVSYGHFIMDFMSPLMVIPDSALKGAVIVCKKNPFVLEYIKYVGLSNEIVMLEDGEWAQCSQVYYPGKPRPHCQHQGGAYMKLGRLIRKSLGLENVIPDRYVLSNRITKYRQLYNMDEAFEKVKEKYPQYNWEIHNMTPKPLTELAKIWGHAVILFAVAGSNLMNAFLFAKGSVLVEMLGDVNDYSAIDSPLASQAKLILFFDRSLGHYKEQKNFVNIDQLLTALKAAFYYLDNRNWPTDGYGSVLRYSG